MRNSLFTVAVASAFCASIPSALAQADDDLRNKVHELEQQLKTLQRQIELSDKASAEKAKNTPVLSAGASGFSFRSADSNFVLRLRGYVQADSRWWINDSAGGNANDTFLLRRVRPIFEGTVFGNYDFRVMLDFGSGVNPSVNNDAYVQDAYFTARWLPEFQFQGGKFKEPVGLERLQSGANLLFVERGYPTGLVPNRDVGFMLHGDIAEGLLNYQVGAFNGVADGGSADIETSDDEKDGVARVFAHPFMKTGIEPLHGLGVGIGGSYGNQEGALRTFVSPGQQRIFGYSTGVVADGEHWRLSPQGYWYWGPLGVFGEYVVSNQKVRGTGGFDRFEHKAWQVAASYVLTGEKNSWRGITPKKPVSLCNGGWGAWEIAARIQQLDVDDDVFAGFASATSSATEANSWGIGLNWHLNRNFKFQVNYEQSDFKGGTSELLRDGERIVFTRAQVSF